MAESRTSALLANRQRFTYTGPLSGVTLQDPDDPTAEPLEQMLFDGATVELPADHPHVKALVAQKFLTPAATTEPIAAAPESTRSTRRSAASSSTSESTN